LVHVTRPITSLSTIVPAASGLSWTAKVPVFCAFASQIIAQKPVTYKQILQRETVALGGRLLLTDRIQNISSMNNYVSVLSGEDHLSNELYKRLKVIYKIEV
jgi:hypothetical protein